MRILGRTILGSFIGLAALSGCRGPDAVTPDPVFPGGGGTGLPASSAYIDSRALESSPVTLEDAPPPLSGGTLRVVGGGAFIIAADSDRDRILVVESVSRIVTEVALGGSEPGRIAEDGEGRVHVALRGSGEIYSFDPARPTEGERRTVCPMPRGLAYDARIDAVHVACRGGELVSMPAAGGEAISSMLLDDDLRDVVVTRDGLAVTRFRSAELIRLDLEGHELRRDVPDEVVDSMSFTGTTPATFRPAVAWRAVPISGVLEGDGDDEVAVVHQRASDGELQLAPGAYYSTSACSGSIVQSAITIFDSEGGTHGGVHLYDATLPVDMAVSPDGSNFAIVAAGNQTGLNSVQLISRQQLEEDPSLTFGCAYATPLTQPEYDPVTYEPVAHDAVSHPVAVAFDALGNLWIQQREPARLVVVPQGAATDAYGYPTAGFDYASRTVIELGGGSAFDAGHALFHANAGRSTACASCHPEGGDDGRAWVFANLGPRRTPVMHVGIADTAPFHWDGDLADMGALMNTVFSERMGGPRVSPPQARALSHWVNEIPRPVASEPVDADAVSRGAGLYWGAAQCGDCHSGEMLTNNQTTDVGTGGRFQVPSLVGVAFRLPVMHDGCATTLRARFEPGCGGATHGNVGALGSTEIDDLVAYLQTL